MPVFDPGAGDLPPPFEPGGKPASRPGGGPPGGGPGGGPNVGPGSAFGGVGGLNPQVFRLLSGMGQTPPIMVRRRGVQIPGLTPGPPGRSDTVPAMLSPGEMVMNNGVTQNPDIAAILAQLNMAGAQQPQGFEHGGMVMGKCPHCGGDCSPQGYAYGGVVPGPGPMTYGTQPPAPQPAPGIGSIFGGGFPGGLRGAFQQGVRNAGTPGSGPAQPGAPGGSWTGGYTYNPQGGVTNYNPNDPWGGFTNNRDPSFTGQGARGLGGFGQAGYFDPRGNQMLLNAMNEGAQGTADALVRRQMTQADLSGLDPAQRAVAKLQALRDTGRGVQDIMANTRGQVLGNQNDFAQNLYQMLLSGSLGQISADQQAKLNDWLNNNQQNRAHKDQWGNIASGVLGAGIGGYMGGLGQAMGTPKPKKPSP